MITIPFWQFILTITVAGFLSTFLGSYFYDAIGIVWLWMLHKWTAERWQHLRDSIRAWRVARQEERRQKSGVQ